MENNTGRYLAQRARRRLTGGQSRPVPSPLHLEPLGLPSSKEEDLMKWKLPFGKVFRGGSWFHSWPAGTRAADRIWEYPVYSGSRSGFRVIRKRR